MNQHLVRIGLLGHVGRFTPVDAARHARGTRVVCRTERGLEVGEVLTLAEHGGPADGTLLRRVTVEDELLLARLDKHKHEAFRSCERMLAARGFDAVLMDVEHLFDGQSLFFYFLGETPPGVEAVTSELAEAYEAKVQFRKFTETLTAGCGPACGTEDAEGGGCGSGGCSTCSVATACKTSVRKA